MAMIIDKHLIFKFRTESGGFNRHQVILSEDLRQKGIGAEAYAANILAKGS